MGRDDVVNIAIAGVKKDGSPGLNKVSYIILEAVKNCNIPGPNLSARIYKGIPDASGGGVTFSGGEPLLQADFCSALAERCSSQDIPVIVDTASHVTYSEFEKLLPYKVHFFYDLKAASEEDYRTKTGGSLALAATNLSRLVSDGAQVTVRIPIIPEFSDSILYCQRLRDILRQTKVEAVHLLPFHRSGSSKYKALNKNYVYEKVQAPSEEKLNRLLKVFAYDFDARIDG